jgi:alpha-L-fucosidase
MITACAWLTFATAQSYKVPVSEAHEKMQTGKYEPTWESLR